MVNLSGIHTYNMINKDKTYNFEELLTKALQLGIQRGRLDCGHKDSCIFTDGWSNIHDQLDKLKYEMKEKLKGLYEE